MIPLLTPWNEITFIGFDLETTGKYPLDAEICEMAAVKWKDGKVADEFQSLIKPTKPMSKEVIAIHNITNEMVASAPALAEVLPRFHRFIQDGILIAHHAPFDMGFLSFDFERMALPLPPLPVLCTAIISRKAIPNSPNHRLQTLIKHLHIKQGAAHRALDDARACLEVGLKCFERIGPAATLRDLQAYQGGELTWKRFSMEDLAEKENYRILIGAALHHREVNMVYQGGSRPGQARPVIPVGIVRNPDGDFLVAREPGEEQTKRYFLQQIGKVTI